MLGTMSIHRCPASRVRPHARSLLPTVANRIFPLLLLLAGALALPASVHAQPIAEPTDAGQMAGIEIGVATMEFPSPDESFPAESPPAESPPIVADSAESSDVYAAFSDFAAELPIDPQAWEATYRLALPNIRYQPPPASLNVGSRASVLAYYNAFFRVATPPMGWTGNYGTCSAGATSAAYLEATRKRIAYYRSMAGVPNNVVMYGPFVQQAQAAALMMSANKQLSHTPSSNWRCYSEAGKTAAGAANIASAPGPVAIDLYMHDSGGNSAVGHRRWLLYPQLSRIGAGSTPSSGDLWGSNVLYVLDGATIWGPRPAVRDGYVAWPPRGYVPYTIVPMRWSFSYPGADFSGAIVSMNRNGAALGVVKEPLAAGYGENTLVWKPQVGGETWARPAADASFQVQISNVRIGGANRTFAYTVIIFDPG